MIADIGPVPTPGGCGPVAIVQDFVEVVGAKTGTAE